MIRPGTSPRICGRGEDFSSYGPGQPCPVSTAQFSDSASCSCRLRSAVPCPSGDTQAPRAALLCCRRDCIPFHADILRRPTSVTVSLRGCCTAHAAQRLIVTRAHHKSYEREVSNKKSLHI